MERETVRKKKKNNSDNGSSEISKEENKNENIKENVLEFLSQYTNNLNSPNVDIDEESNKLKNNNEKKNSYLATEEESSSIDVNDNLLEVKKLPIIQKIEKNKDNENNSNENKDKNDENNSDKNKEKNDGKKNTDKNPEAIVIPNTQLFELTIEKDKKTNLDKDYVLTPKYVYYCYAFDKDRKEYENLIKEIEDSKKKINQKDDEKTGTKALTKEEKEKEILKLHENQIKLNNLTSNLSNKIFNNDKKPKGFSIKRTNKNKEPVNPIDIENINNVEIQTNGLNTKNAIRYELPTGEYLELHLDGKGNFDESSPVILLTSKGSESKKITRDFRDVLKDKDTGNYCSVKNNEDIIKYISGLDSFVINGINVKNNIIANIQLYYQTKAKDNFWINEEDFKNSKSKFYVLDKIRNSEEDSESLINNTKEIIKNAKKRKSKTTDDISSSRFNSTSSSSNPFLSEKENSSSVSSSIKKSSPIKLKGVSGGMAH